MTIPLKTILDTPWDKNHCQDYGVDAPLILGRVAPALLDAPKQKLNDLHVKDKGSREYIIPPEIVGHQELLTLLARVHRHQETINEHIEDFHVFVTVNQSPVKKAASQRRAGVHLDGIQSVKWDGYNYKPDRHYILCSALPTIYHLGEFDTRSVNMAEDNLFARMRECMRENPSGYTKFVPEPYDICFMHAYHAHEVAHAEVDVPQRTFIRITYTQLIYDRLGNSVNPLIKNNWDWSPRPLTFEMFKKQNQNSGGDNEKIIYGGRVSPAEIKGTAQ